MQIDIMPAPLDDPHLENLSGSQILLWAEGKLTQIQRQRLLNWVEQGLSILLLGSASLLLGSQDSEDENDNVESLHGEGTPPVLQIVPVRNGRKK